MTAFEIGQKIRHIKWGDVGTFLGTTGNQFTVQLDHHEQALDPIPLEYMNEWTSEVTNHDRN